MSSSLVSLNPFVPVEFSRKPRSLDELGIWKSVEFRQIILYTGMVFLIDYVEAEFYQHFLLLAIGYRIFAGSAVFNENITFEDAAHMLEQFVGDFHRFYGEENLSYNVHNLLHVYECHKEFGNLMGFSAYAFENYLKTMKQNVKMEIAKEKNFSI